MKFNPDPAVCRYCGAKIWGAVGELVKCPKCGKPWPKKNAEFLTKTSEQRRATYQLARDLGLSSSQARRVRQWRSPKMFRMLGLPVPSLSERRAMGLVNPQWRPTESPQSKAMIKAEEAMIIKDWLDKIKSARDPAERMNIIRDLVRQAKADKISFDTVRKIVSQGGLLSEMSMMLKSKTLNPMAQMLRLSKPIDCSLCGKPVKDKYIIKDKEKFYHLKCFQVRQKNPKLGSRTHLESHHTKSEARAALLKLKKDRPDRVHRMWYSEPYQRWIVGSYIHENPPKWWHEQKLKELGNLQYGFTPEESYHLTGQEYEEEAALAYYKRKKNPPFKYGSFKCKECGKQCKVWVEADTYKLKLCPKCLDKAGLGFPIRLKLRNPESLYESFHGTSPLRTRKVMYEPPKGVLTKIGRLSQINYVPEHPSKKAGTEFYHVSGDTGEQTLKSNMILATDQRGRNLYLLRDGKSQFPKFTERGIIG